MAIEGLTIIGESINDSVPSTKKLFDANDLEGILALAKSQDEKGAAYIDVNVGRRSASFMAEMVRGIQRVTPKPLSIDTPDLVQAKAALEAYDHERSGGKLPILNSISPLRPEMFELYGIRSFVPILMVSERIENGVSLPNRTGRETYHTAKEMLCTVRRLGRGIANDQLIVDPGIAPIGTDSEGMLGRVLEAMKLIREDPEFQGIHMSVGLSNFTVMLPSKRADGTPLKSALESAFLTLAMPVGLDMIIGSMARKYEVLPADHPALACLHDCLGSPGFDAILRVKEFYS
jgi:5-methyltetrahydrofolate--homocysteine methyltransferase